MAFPAPILVIIARLKSLYNGDAYSASTNPGGMASGGHRLNFIPALRDISDVGVAIAAQADAAAASAQSSSTRATDSDTSAQAAAGFAQNALGFANAAAESFDQFDDRYLGSKMADPTKDNDGNDLIEGALYWNRSTDPITKGLRVWSGGKWNAGAFTITGGVLSFKGRVGIVLPDKGDYNSTQITGLATRSLWRAMIY